MFAAQTDFTEPGELSLFLTEGQVALLEDLMWRQGNLDADQMAGAFTLLRSNDLLWSRAVRECLPGERARSSDMMAWNADATRLPARMHSEYLRGLFLENRLATGARWVDGRPVSLTDLCLPVCAAGTETDHVAPWRSVFKIQCLTETETETAFILTNGGRNAGILSEPGHPRRHHRFAVTARDDPWRDADDWLAAHAPRAGSWWPTWADWLAERSAAPGPAAVAGPPRDRLPAAGRGPRRPRHAALSLAARRPRRQLGPGSERSAPWTTSRTAPSRKSPWATRPNCRGPLPGRTSICSR